MNPSFNLVDEPWIPVLGSDGAERLVSMRTAICNAHEYRDIAVELPTMRFAILRILLAVSYRVLDREPDEDPHGAWRELWDEPVFEMALFDEYFTQWHDRFNLTDPVHPFMQTSNLRTSKDDWKPVWLIVADVDPEGALFSMRSELDTLSLAEACRWLIHAHAYDYSGIKSGAVGDPRVKGGKGYPSGIGWAGWLGGVVIGGETLRETILLNLVRNRSALQPGDVPIWEQSPLGPARRSPAEIGTIGPVSLMTWPQRRIRLRVQAGEVVGVLVSNGDPLDYTEQWGNELMSGWRFSEPQTLKAKSVRYMPRTVDEGSALWRGLSTLVPTSQNAVPAAAVKKKWNLESAALPAGVIAWLGELVRERQLSGNHVVEVSVVSMIYGTQSASYSGIAFDRLSFAAVLAETVQEEGLLQTAQAAAALAIESVTSLSRFARDLVRAAGGDGEGAFGQARDAAFVALDHAYRGWLLELTPGCDSEKLLHQWREALRHEIRDRGLALVDDAPPAAWIGRVDTSGMGVARVLSVATTLNSFERELVRVLGMSLRNPEMPEVGTAGNTDQAEEPVVDGLVNRDITIESEKHD